MLESAVPSCDIYELSGAFVVKCGELEDVRLFLKPRNHIPIKQCSVESEDTTDRMTNCSFPDRGTYRYDDDDDDA
jgi:hypothetical protein